MAEALTLPYPEVGTDPAGFVDDLDLHETAFIAPGATVVGRVSLGARSSVWYQAVLRGDVEPIVVGCETNIQDGSVLHGAPGMPTRIGDRVTIGHRCVVHACTVGDDVLIGMGAIVLDGCILEDGAVIAAGAVVREGTRVPAGTLWAGVPAQEKGAVPAKLAARFDLPPAQLALLWVKDQPGVTAPLCGPRTADQLDDLLPVIEMTLTEDMQAACDQLVPPGCAIADFLNSAPWMKGKVR